MHSFGAGLTNVMRLACRSRSLAALAAGGAIAIVAKDAEACSCPSLAPQYQLPQPGGTLPANGVIVLAMSPVQSPVLLDSAGLEVPIDVVPTHSIWGGCLSSIAFARPVQPLAVGESFSAGPATFTVTAPLEPTTTDLAVAFELVEHAPVNHSFHYCSAPDETTRSVGVRLSFTSPDRVVLVAEASSGQVDQRPPVIIDAGAAASSDLHSVRRFAEDAQQGCGNIWVYDVTGALLKQAEQCFTFPPPSDGGSTSPDSGSTSPDSGSTSPDSGSTSPDSGSTSPDSGSTSPDAASSPAPDSDSNRGCHVAPRGRGSLLAAALVLAGLAFRQLRRSARSALD